MKILIRILIWLVIVMAFPLERLSAQAEEKPIDDIVASIQERYKPIHSIESNFIQKNFIAPLNQFRKFQGKLFLQRPSLFAMEVTSPECQRLVFDGKFFWIYTASNNQALKNPVAPEFLHHPLISLLTTMEDLKRHFHISLAKTNGSFDYSLTLTLKHLTSDIREVQLTVGKNDFQIKELTFKYDSGNYTQLALVDTKENPSIAPEHFQFLPPPETEIVESPTPIVQPQ